MPYLGNQVSTGSYRKLTDISVGFDSTTTTFQLSVPPGTAAYYVTPGSIYQLLISVNNVIKNPGVDYTINGNQITFITAPSSGQPFFGILLGDALNIGSPSDGTITDAKVATGAAIANSKISFSTLGNYASDSAAASGGVLQGSLYRNGSVVQVRVV
jgi:hypothetical protein